MNHVASSAHIFAKYFLTLLLILSAAGLYAQLGTLSVQGVLTKSDGTAVDDATYTLKFRLWKDPSSTNPADKVHEEDLMVETTGGVYSTILGLTTPFGPSATFAEVYYLGVNFGSSELLPRPRLTAAPYAMGLLGGSNVIAGAGNITVDGVLSDSYKFKSSPTSGMFWESPDAKLKLNGADRLLIGNNGTNYFTGSTVFNNETSTTGRVNSSVGFGYNATGTGLFFDGTENKASIYTTGNVRFHAWDDGKNYYRATNGHLFDVGGVQVSNNLLVNGRTNLGGGGPNRATLTVDATALDISDFVTPILNTTFLFSQAVWLPLPLPNGYGVSIYANGPVLSTGFFMTSDARIKNIIGQSNRANDLELLNKIKITDYTYIDKKTKGNKVHKKVIAQEVAQVYPEAVMLTTDVVPDIYQYAPIKAGRVEIKNNLKAGEKVQLMLGREKKILEVLAADAEGFSIPTTWEGLTFVYGREVNDFHSVDYEALSTLNISATQELAQKVERLEAENAALRAKLEANQTEFSAQLNALSKRVQAMEAMTGNR
ncbi:MAG: tail fiber domain-containing protein [Saprospiraceae bacterium]